MRLLAFVLLLFWQLPDSPPAPKPESRFFRYQRAVDLHAATAGTPACAVLDAAIYAHAAPFLKDLRLYTGTRELPYAITLSGSSDPQSDPARILNLATRANTIVFDLAMPSRPYTDVVLDLDAHDFIAAARVTGPGHPGTLQLGTFTLFDLSTQRLSRATTLHLQETTLPLLHIELTLSPAPGTPRAAFPAAIVQAASVPPSREAQTLFTTAAETTFITQQGRFTLATLRLPAHVPAERLSVTLAPTFTGNFSREIDITATPNSPNPTPEHISGTIERVHLAEAGHDLRQQQLTIPATLGANLQDDATIDLRIDNGDDPPLPLAAIALDMRERRLCFPLPTTTEPLTLFYGDPALAAPVYDFARTFSPATSVSARLAPEQPNPAYTARPAPTRTLTERHPELLWVALLAVVCTLAVVATHSAKRMPR